MLKRNRRGDAEDFDEEISVLPDDERKSLLSSNNNKSQSSKIKLKNEDQEMEIPLNRYKEPTVEVEIDSQTESLQTLSLRYNVPISELKRCNQIMNDAEFYGLKKIKIPVNPNTVMAGLLIPGLNVEGSDTAVATPSNGGKTDQGWVIESNVLGASSVYSSPLSDESDSALSTTASKSPLMSESPYEEPKQISGFTLQISKLRNWNLRNSPLLNFGDRSFVVRRGLVALTSSEIYSLSQKNLSNR